MIGIDPDLARFAVILEGIDLPTMVVGSVASSAYGEPRATLDIGLVVAALPEDAERIAAAFSAQRYLVPPIEVMRRELGRTQGTFNLIDGETSLKADIYPVGSDPLNRAGFAARLEIDVPGAGMLYIAPPTTVIGGKLRYFAMSRQEKHLRDIRSMLAISGEQVDSALLADLAERLGVSAAWLDCIERAGEE